jgi:NitT/TauT family transport system ATP-binding protein
LNTLKITHINKTFITKHKTVQTLQDINLEIKAGEFICIIGASGCGKTTLLNIIAGLEKATSGSVIVDNHKIYSPGADRTVLFQEAALFPWLRVIDNVEFGMKMLEVPKEERRAKSLKYLDIVKLKDFQNSFIHELSGGMKQRVALARALAVDSDILLMDEPFSALDNQTRNILLDELQNIWLETKKTIIFITHNIDEAVYLANRVVIMSSAPGRIKKIMDIDINRPRKRLISEYISTVEEILEEMTKDTEKVGENNCEYEKII